MSKEGSTVAAQIVFNHKMKFKPRDSRTASGVNKKSCRGSSFSKSLIS